MKLYFKKKQLSAHNRYFIYNENDEQIYELGSQFTKSGEKIRLKDMEGRELIYVEQEFLHWMPHYNAYIKGEFVSKVVKKYRFFHNDYELLELGYTVRGNGSNSSYIVKDREKEIIATIKRDTFGIGLNYQIEIFDEKKILSILIALIAIINGTNKELLSISD